MDLLLFPLHYPFKNITMGSTISSPLLKKQRYFPREQLNLKMQIRLCHILISNSKGIQYLKASLLFLIFWRTITGNGLFTLLPDTIMMHWALRNIFSWKDSLIV